MSKINFKKSKINKKYLIKYKKSSVILCLQKDFGYLELGKNRALLKTHLYILL